MNLIEFLKRQNIIPEKKSIKFIKILEQYSENDVLYPDVVKELDLTVTEHERLFNELEKRDYISAIYIIQCPYCNELGNTYVDENDIPFMDHCRFCEAEFNHQENHMQAYRLYFNYDEEVDVNKIGKGIQYFETSQHYTLNTNEAKEIVPLHNECVRLSITCDNYADLYWNEYQRLESTFNTIFGAKNLTEEVFKKENNPNCYLDYHCTDRNRSCDFPDSIAPLERTFSGRKRGFSYFKPLSVAVFYQQEF